MSDNESLRSLIDRWRCEESRMGRIRALEKLDELSCRESAWLASSAYQVEQCRISAEVEEMISELEAAFSRDGAPPHE